MLKKIFLFIALVFLSAAIVRAQSVTGKVLDAETNQPVPGVTVTPSSGTGAVTVEDGTFSVVVTQKSGNIKLSHVGYDVQTLTFKIAENGTGSNLGTILLKKTESTSLEEIVVVGKGVIDLARDRATPIAVSTIKGTDIQDKIGTGDVTQAMVNTPSVYIGNQASGFGDSRVFVRGFGQDNTAYLLNGQPINGMEDGLVYWSNWSGMSDIANAIQIQRGLGSSKLAISSVGGTVNFVTKATEMRQGGFASFGIANDNYYKGTIGYNTGLSKNGWGASIMLSHWQGDGYNDGTRGQGQNYFLSIGYKPSDKHNFNFLLTGAPQWHDQNFADNITDYKKYGRKYNGNWGYLKGEYLSERRNFYHKPVANFNWDFNINSTTDLSTVVYASWGRGGGTGNYGSSTSRKVDANGQYLFDSVYAKNTTGTPDGIGSQAKGNYIIRSSMNNHAWYGVVSNLGKKLSENLKLNVGMDLRTYKGSHYRQVENFLGLEGWTEGRGLRGADHSPASQLTMNTVNQSMKADPWKAFFNTIDDNQKIDYDYGENITYGGLFGQLEYATDAFSTFFQGAVSTQSHKRQDIYDYLPEFRDADKVNNMGFNVKGGASYKPAQNHIVYANAGYYSRQPYHDNIYLNFTNEINPLTSNEKILGLELGYSFTSPIFTASVNAYRTSWSDRVTTTSTRLNADKTYGSGITVPAGDFVYTSNQGVEQVHTGVELDFVLRPINKLNVTGFVSLGNWEYNGDVLATLRNEGLEFLEESRTDVDGGKVGGSAQTTFGLGGKYDIVKGLSVDADWRYYANNYATRVVKDNLELPAYNVMDAGLSYKFFLKNNKNLRLRFNVNNLFHAIYLSDATTVIKATDNIVANDPSKGTYESTGRLYKGIADANQVYFGLGRTWTVTLRYTF